MDDQPPTPAADIAPPTEPTARPWWRQGRVLGGVGVVVGFATGIGSAVALHEVTDGRDDDPLVQSSGDASDHQRRAEVPTNEVPADDAFDDDWSSQGTRSGGRLPDRGGQMGDGQMGGQMPVGQSGAADGRTAAS